MVIASRHNSHAKILKWFVCGKHVFVEKPLRLTKNFRDLEEFYESLGGDENTPLLMVGYNRRFSPQVKKIKKLLFSYNELDLLSDSMWSDSFHWLHDEEIGGGRILEGMPFY